MQQDSSQQWYVELDFPSPDVEKLRLTLIPSSTARGGKPAVRFQIRNDCGLHQGPEASIESAKDISAAMIELVQKL
jgi:hypothetical protein